jgi:hypothetical protein
MPQEHSTYWQLVEELMHFGWYREGQDLKRDRSGRTWRFREGHTTNDRPVRELAAMRILVDELRQADRIRRVRPFPE